MCDGALGPPHSCDSPGLLGALGSLGALGPLGSLGPKGEHETCHEGCGQVIRISQDTLIELATCSATRHSQPDVQPLDILQDAGLGQTSWQAGKLHVTCVMSVNTQ